MGAATVIHRTKREIRWFGTGREVGDQAHNRKRESDQTQESNVVRGIYTADLTCREIPYEFQGHHYDGANISFIMIDAPPGSSPTLHEHPYEEEIVVQEGALKFTAGAGVIEAGAGQVVVGSRKRFFEDRSDQKALELVDSKTFSNGVVYLAYRPATVEFIRGPGYTSVLYSPECVEVVFCELCLDGVLRS
jgi:quercetin dioxygenase-like cupin family protein